MTIQKPLLSPLTAPLSGVLGASLLLTACGGGGSGGGSNTPTLPPPPAATTIQTGVFKDANVAGLSYASGGQSGVTGADGRFRCETGEDVSFSVGAVNLGSTECATLVIPASLTASGELDDPLAVGLVRFLQMLDFDGDPGNGIEISADVQEIAATWSQPDFTAENLEIELASIISDAFSVDQTPHDLPPAPLALAQATAVAQCAFAGAFYGTASGEGSSGAMMLSIGYQGVFAPSFTPEAVEWQAYDAGEDFGVGGGGGGVRYAARPTIDHSGPNLAGPLRGDFLAPDRITGTWQDPQLDASGTFDVRRLGADEGTYRIIGSYTSNEGPGVLGLSLDGNSIRGEAFDLWEGAIYEVTGTLEGDTVTLSSNTGTGFIDAIGTLTRFTNGEPRAFTARWPDGDVSGSFCRLN